MLRANGGIATPSPYQEFEKPFWTELKDAESYQRKLASAFGITDTEIWMWPNPLGVGYPGPPMDGMPTWLVPNDELPRLGPGVMVPDLPLR